MAEENPKRDIMLDPRWSIFQDGYGYQLLAVGGIGERDKEGREVIRFTVKPDDVVMKRYNLRRGIELDQNGNMELVVLKDDLIALNMYDDANRKWLYVKSLTHNPTDLSNREEDLKKVIKTSKRRILLLEAENIRLAEQLELARTNPAKFIKQGAEVFQESAKAFAEITRKEKD
jgi:hypothetical protein